MSIEIKELGNGLRLTIGLLQHEQITALLTEHHQEMQRYSPEESIHAFDISKLAQDDVTFVTLWQSDELVAMGAYKTLEQHHVELKSMRTAEQFKQQGFSKLLLTEIIKRCQEENINRISLETGTAQAFVPAHRLYTKFGFIDCPPFADYEIDPYSQFMTYAM